MFLYSIPRLPIRAPHNSIEGKPPYAYAGVKVCSTGVPADIMQHGEAFSFGMVVVP